MRRTRQSRKTSAQQPNYHEESDDNLPEGKPVDTSKPTKKKVQEKQKSKHDDITASLKHNSDSPKNSTDDIVKNKSFSPSNDDDGDSDSYSESESEEESESSDDSDFEESTMSKTKRQSKRKPSVKSNPGPAITNGGPKSNKSSLFSKLKIHIKDSISINVKKPSRGKAKIPKDKSDEMSSGSSSDEFVRVKPTESLDIEVSPYFPAKKDEAINDFAAIESKILTDVTEALSDSDSEVEYTDVQWPTLPGTSNSLPDPVKTTAGLHNAEPVSVAAQKSSTRSRKRGKAPSKAKPERKDETNELNVLQLLKLGEGVGLEMQDVGKFVPSDEEDLTDLEEVSLDEEEVCETEVKPHMIPKEGVQITLDAPEIFHKRKKKDFDMEAYLLRRLNNRKRSIQVLIHKVHLLACLYHGQFVNSVLNSEDLMGLSLSLIPSQHCYPPKRADLGYLESIIKWFKKTVPLKEDIIATYPANLLQSLLAQFNAKTAESKRDLVLMFICILRSLGIQARLVVSLQPAPLKLASTELCTSLAKKTDSITTQSVKKELNEDNAKPGPSKNKSTPTKNVQSKSKNSRKQSDKTKKGEVKSKYFDDKSDKFQNSKTATSSTSVKRKQAQRSVKTSKYFKDSEGSSSLGDKTPKPVKKKSKAVKEEAKSTKINESESQDRKILPSRLARMNKLIVPVSSLESDDADFEPEPKRRKSKGVPEKKVSAKKSSKMPVKELVDKTKRQSMSKVKSEAEDSDFKPQELTSASDSEEVVESGEDFEAQNIPAVKLPTRDWSGKLDRRVLSTDSEGDSAKKTIKKRRLSKNKSDKKPEKKKIGIDVWTEVFLEAEEKWFSVDVPRQKVHCSTELLAKATQPMLYVVSFNNDASIKDVTRRYVVNWTTIKQRVDESWWEKAIAPFLGKKTPQDLEEDEELSDCMLNHPLPSVIGEYKNHPLYVLKRHLLKFEAIYPPDAPTLGFVRGEAVYSRECVVGLHSREVWVKEAKVVKPGEQPYKIVKARPKYDKMSGSMITDMPLEVFGLWQVGEYVPPVAENGKVPRNEYGNVELFKPCMLPKGTVHLPIPGLSRVAKKLGIDCAPAMIGFDYHSGGSHPTYDGYVVCEEHKDIMLDAWRQDVEESEKRANEKYEKRVYDNWKRLIKGLLIRERLKARYSFGDVQPSTSNAKSRKTTAKKNRTSR